MPTNTHSTDTTLSSDRAKASAWARSMGYPVPTQLNGCLALFLVVVGLCIWIIPGLVILVILFSMNQSYNREMDELVARWVDAGKPEPGIVRNEVTANVRQLTSVDNTSMTEKLAELEEMRSNSLISEEEYEILRKKALGL